MQIENGCYVFDIISQEVGLGGFFGDLNLLGILVFVMFDVCVSVINVLGFINSFVMVLVVIYGYVFGVNVVLCLFNLLFNLEILVVWCVLSVVIFVSVVVVGQVYLQDLFCSMDIVFFVFSSNSVDFVLKDKICVNVVLLC